MIKLFKNPTLLSLAYIALTCAPVTMAADVTVEVRDSKGNKLKDAIVYVENSKVAKQTANKEFEIEQRAGNSIHKFQQCKQARIFTFLTKTK